MKLKAILFDKDGTLFDFQQTWGRWAAAEIGRLARGDSALADDLAGALGVDLDRQAILPESPIIAGTVAEVAGRIGDVLPEAAGPALVAALDAGAQRLVPVPAAPMPQTLDALRARGLRLGVATNDSEATALAHLDAHGLRDRFDFIAGYDSGHGGKPGPGMCLAFAEAVSASPGEVAMVGDSLHDLLAGRAAGMVCVGVLTGLAGEADLSPQADVVLSDIGQLTSWLDARG